MNFKDGSDSLIFSIDTNAAEKIGRKWNLEIKQIPCDSTLLGKVRTDRPLTFNLYKFMFAKIIL